MGRFRRNRDEAGGAAKVANRAPLFSKLNGQYDVFPHACSGEQVAEGSEGAGSGKRRQL